MYPTQRSIPKSYPKLDNQKTTIINKVILCIRGAKRFLINNQVKYFNLDSELRSTRRQHGGAVTADTDHLWHGDVRSGEWLAACLHSRSHLHSGRCSLTCLGKRRTPSGRLTHKHQPTRACQLTTPPVTHESLGHRLRISYSGQHMKYAQVQLSSILKPAMKWLYYLLWFHWQCSVV